MGTESKRICSALTKKRNVDWGFICFRTRLLLFFWKAKTEKLSVISICWKKHWVIFDKDQKKTFPNLMRPYLFLLETIAAAFVEFKIHSFPKAVKNQQKALRRSNQVWTCWKQQAKASKRKFYHFYRPLKSCFGRVNRLLCSQKEK